MHEVMSLHAYYSNMFILSYMQNVENLNDCQNLLFYSRNILNVSFGLYMKRVQLFVKNTLCVILLHVHKISDTLL